MAYNQEPFRHFQSWVDHHKVKGFNGHGHDADYVPYEDLEDYWQDDRIDSVVKSDNPVNPITVPAKEIRDRSLRIFSVLVYISRAGASRITHMLGFCENDLDDDNLPFTKHPEALPRSNEGTDAWEAFQLAQYLFRAVSFLPKKMFMRKLPLEMILPLTLDKVISGSQSDDTVVKSYTLQPSSGLHRRRVVMKEFPASEQQYTFKNEVMAYTELDNSKLEKGRGPVDLISQSFLEYHGSFIFGDRGFIVLEYAEEGTLHDFFKKNNQPHDGSEFRDKYKFKIGDFGLSSRNLQRPGEAEKPGPDNQSTKMYGAPELTNHQSGLAHLDQGATWAVDIWSFGCVLSEVLVWIVWGYRGIEKFLEKRREASQKIPGHVESGYEASFHDGTKRISAVDQILTDILTQRPGYDDVLQGMSTIILERMLVPKEDRLPAGQLYSHFLAVLQSHLPEGQDAEHVNTEHGVLQPVPTSQLVGRGSDRNSQRREIGMSSKQTVLHARNRYPSLCNSQEGPSTGKESAQSLSSSLLQGHESNRVSGQWNKEEPRRSEVHTRDGRSRNYPYAESTSNPENTRFLGANHRRNSELSQLQPPQGTIATRPTVEAQPSLYSKTTISEVNEWIKNRKKLSRWRRWVLSSPSCREFSEDHKKVLKKLKDRQQIFILDDSRSMREKHWREVNQAFRALSYLVKDASSYSIELYLTSELGEGKCASKKITKLTDFINRSPDNGDDCDMAFCLDAILTKVKRRLSAPPSRLFKRRAPRKVSIYILTDGIWEGSNQSKKAQDGVEEPIKSLVMEVQRLRLGRHSVSMQFIRFGDNPLAEQRLLYLDDGLGKELNLDIVDRRSSDESVWLMLVGSISRAVDNDNDHVFDKSEEDNRHHTRVAQSTWRGGARGVG